MSHALVDALRAAVHGTVTAPGEEAWDTARSAYNLVLDQRPLAVVVARDAADVAAVVRVAAAHGARVAPQGTGHGAAARASLERAVLLRTDRLTAVDVDPRTRVVRAGAGATWGEVAAVLDRHGLAALAGTSATVRMAGYTLGGGIGFLARKHGLAANQVVAAELVTAAGRVVRADAANEPDLFWALRGGGGNFGILTALEFRAVPVRELFAGALFWDITQAERVLAAWRGWIADAPEELTSTARLLRLPPIPELPDHLRGRSFAMVQGAFLGDARAGAALWAPLRALEPEMDTLEMMPPSRLATINMDPPDPVPYGGDGGLLSGFPAEAAEALLAVAGPAADCPLLSLELRHLGGAVARPDARNGAIAAIDAPFAWFGVGFVPDPALGPVVEAGLDRIAEALRPWDSGRAYMNFAERPRTGDVLFGRAHARLRSVRAAYDPEGLFQANHEIAPA